MTVWFRLREVDLDFLDRAGRVWVAEANVAAPPDRVWSAVADPGCWHHWFPGVEKAWYEGEPPFGVGTVRKARVSGQRYEELMRAWEEPVRWAYCITGASLPVARAQLEVTELEACDDGTRVRWTVAADPGPLLWLASPFFGRTISRLWRRAASNLEGWLAEKVP